MKISESRKHTYSSASNSRSLITGTSIGNPRKKKHDYTIPVRLNRQLPSCLANKLLEISDSDMFILEDRRVTTKEKRKDEENQILASARYIQYIFSKYQRHVQQEQKPITEMPARFEIASKRAQHTTNQISIKLTLMILASASFILITSMSKFCYCDTTYKINKNDYDAIHSIQTSIEAQHGNLLRRNNAFDSYQSDKHLGSSNSVNYKENLLSYLTDDIERQHFKNHLKPVRAFVRQRPSKFDSGEDSSEEASDAKSGFSINRSRGIVNRNITANNRHSNINKVDEGLRQIMMMHEHALPPMTSGQKQQQQESGLSKTSNSVTNLALKLKELSRSPARVASSLINPNKMMSNVLSYISPLVNAKFTNSTSTGSILNFNPFAGRSNNQVEYSPAAKNLLSFALSSDYPSTSSKSSSSVTNLPQTSFLSKPSIEKANERYFSPTQATISLNNLADTVLKSALIKPNISPKDLLTSESLDSFSHSANSVSSSIPTPGNSIDDSPSKQQPGGHSSNKFLNSRNLLKPLVSSHSGSSWLKDNANKVAQSYIQDSFRGLLTLSQLPILQAGPISTAPSVLEKGSKLKDSNKQPGGSSLSSAFNSSSERSRAIDELYRYAYILGTGVRRKRDPLTALESSSSASKLAHSALTNRKGVFSQRSRNQFKVSSVRPASNKQLLDYAKSLRSILSTGAKPRGVMWDMATDPSLAVTVFHLLERASVALPLGE